VVEKPVATVAVSVSTRKQPQPAASGPIKPDGWQMQSTGIKALFRSTLLRANLTALRFFSTR
jgi:hypothetical protein